MQNGIIEKIIEQTVHLMGDKPLSPDEAKTRILLDIGVDIDSADYEILQALSCDLANTGWPEKMNQNPKTNSPQALNLSDINIESLEEVSIIDPLGVVRSGFKIISRQPDRNGLVSVLDGSSTNVIRVHPTRISELCEGSTAIDYGHKLVAICPKCGDICTVRPTSGKCGCGKFKIINTITHELPSAKATHKKTVETVDIADFALKGEIWAKSGVPFDDPSTEVIAVSYRVGDYYLSFNLYNGSLGKKESSRMAAGLLTTKQRILNLQNGVDLDKSKGMPYKIASIEAWRKKLIANGYKQLGV